MRAAAAAHLLLAGGVSCLRTTSGNAEGGFVYDYTRHGQDWIMATCASRMRQSPIDFPDMLMTPSGKFSHAYQVVPWEFDLTNNGHAFSANFAGLGFGGVTYENAWYDLLNVNVHAASEHTFAGLQRPLELHLVHKRWDGDALLLIAVTFEGREAPLGSPPVPDDPVLQSMLKVPLPPVNAKVTVPGDMARPLDLNGLMRRGDFFEYAGSLSAPPCVETATWLVRRDALVATAQQVAALSEAIVAMNGGVGNFRTVMPLNGRAVIMRKAVEEEEQLTPANDVQVPEGPKPALEGREARAMRWAKDALKIATASADYVRDLDQRLHKAAQAHANALLPVPAAPGLPAAAPLAAAAPVLGPTAAPLTGAEAVVAAISAQVAEVAKQAVSDAVKELSVQTKAAALTAARDAAQQVMREMLSPGPFPGPMPGGPVPAPAPAPA